MPRSGNGTKTRDGQNVALIHDRIRELILSGQLKAGATTTQVELGRALETGRTPLREALRMLQREGLVLAEPNRRVRIAGLSADDAEELYVMRMALEGVAIRITVPTFASADIAELEGMLAQMEHFMRAHDGAGLRAPHRAFHMKLVSGSGPRVVTTIGQLFDHAERYRMAYGATSDGGWEKRAQEHRAIVAATADADADLAAKQLMLHYSRTASLVFAALDPEHDLARLRTTLQTVAPGAEAALTGVS
jgi:DNA-binding GntR family transcriptional regulator